MGTRKTSLFIAAILFGELLAQQPAQPPANAATKGIPLTKIALRSEELTRTLRDISRRLPLGQELVAFDKELLEQEELLRFGLNESKNLLASGATTMALREQEREWSAYQLPVGRERKALNTWGVACEQSIAFLAQQQALWEATLKSVNDLQEIESVVARIRQALSEIEALKVAAEERLRIVVGLQGRVSKRAEAVADILESLSEATQQFQARLFYPDAQPIWRVSVTGQQGGASMNTLLSRSLAHSTRVPRALLKVARNSSRGPLWC